MREILQASDEALSWSDFRELFHVGTPAGTYEEIVYFLPITLRYMQSSARDSLEFMSGVCGFVAHHVQRLEADSLLQATMESIADIFRAWTKSFAVVHYDTDACRKKGWSIDYQDIVVNIQEVSELIADLWRYPARPDLADSLVEELARQQGDHTKSAWLLEYARAILEDYATWPWNLNMVPTKSPPVIPRLLQDRRLLQEHYDRIAGTVVAATDSPTYWRDIRDALGLHAI